MACENHSLMIAFNTWTWARRILCSNKDRQEARLQQLWRAYKRNLAHGQGQVSCYLHSLQPSDSVIQPSFDLKVCTTCPLSENPRSVNGNSNLWMMTSIWQVEGEFQAFLKEFEQSFRLWQPEGSSAPGIILQKILLGDHGGIHCEWDKSIPFIAGSFRK